MLIGADHSRSEPSISGCNTSPHCSDAHRGRTSGGVSRQHSLMSTRRRVSVRRKQYGGLCEIRAMPWRMGGRAIVGRRCAERIVHGGGRGSNLMR
eukprot:1309266-Prymnesium_polylepis.1